MICLLVGWDGDVDVDVDVVLDRGIERSMS